VKSCLVTGGAGFIGSHLVAGLLKDGWNVNVLDNFSTGKRETLVPFGKRIRLFDGSITLPSDVEAAMDGCEVVFHLAALPSVALSIADPRSMHENCATGTLNVLKAARDGGIRRVVYASTAAAYGDQSGDLRRETDPLKPLSPYAAAKLAGEHYCSCFTAVYGLETVRLRFFNVFGPGQDPKNPYTGVIAIFLSAMQEGRAPTIFGDGLHARDFVYVENIVQGVLRAAATPAANGNVYNLGMGQAITLLDLVRDLNEVLGTSIVPQHAPQRPGDIRRSQADISAARRDLGYDPQVTFRDGLRFTAAGPGNLVNAEGQGQHGGTGRVSHRSS
jgi:UDP-glucose 4-epimerase